MFVTNKLVHAIWGDLLALLKLEPVHCMDANGNIERDCPKYHYSKEKDNAQLHVDAKYCVNTCLLIFRAML